MGATLHAAPELLAEVTAVTVAIEARRVEERRGYLGQTVKTHLPITGLIKHDQKT